ncbi:hypothetical protein [Aquabacterium sp. OR-4]|uniref:hypothetical protein n=1 Tax=Aquabacterium sp. OR-4 TaxID=2978127 RepID=UPI0028C58B58|nr:hypothetical protein [Aquabacterium sp. OR-4]MDT7838097.1 hypothetical protein [Aquabacterium sp. OR-4]
MALTQVLQSFRSHDVPPWLQACLHSVRGWAQQQGWQWCFMDDAFFDLAPDWARQRCAGNVYALTDLCRLLWAERALADGADRVLWADADVLVFEPARLRWPAGQGHGFARELFLPVDRLGRAGPPQHGINNALMGFEAGDPVLADYRAACEQALRSAPAGPVPRTALGPALLAALGRERPLQVIEGVGLFTLAQMQAIAQGAGLAGAQGAGLAGAQEPGLAGAQRPGLAAGQALLAATLQHSHTPPAAANLCHFLRNATPPAQRPGFDALYGQAVQRLLAHGAAALGAGTA